jgi:hypothetical protein
MPNAPAACRRLIPHSVVENRSMIRARLVLFALAGCFASAASLACRSAGPYDVAQQANSATLVVQNQNFNDVDVYAVAGGLATRIGTVTGNSTARFGLSEALYNSPDFRIVATPIGGNGRASTGPISVSSGQTIEFTIAPVLRMSSVMVR